jgi:PAS domain S-box-containing protein
MRDDEKSKKELLAELQPLRTELARCRERLLAIDTERGELKKINAASRNIETDRRVLMEASQAVLQCRSFEESARQIFDLCRSATGAESGYVALLSRDGKENELLFLESGGKQCSVDPDLPMPVRGLRAKAYSEAAPVYENDFMNSRWVQFMPQGHLRLRNVLFAPLILNEKVVGVIGLANKPEDFTEDDVSITAGLGHIAAIALQRARSDDLFKQSQAKYLTLFEEAIEGVALADLDTGEIIDCNRAFEELTGYERCELIGKPQNVLYPKMPPDSGFFRSFGVQMGEQSGALFTTELVAKSGAIKQVEIKGSPLEISGRKVMQAYLRDVTSELRYQNEKETNLRLLQLMNSSNDTRELIQILTVYMRERTGCEAVGVRLRQGEDFPYFETQGFPPGFVLAENSLCALDAAGEIVRDSAGNPVLECMCGNILCGRFDPDMPFFTPKGSFWTNSTTELLASTSEADRQARTRNRCNGEGYESVALIPLRIGSDTLGLLQLNDSQKDRFTQELITFVENTADQIAIALAQRQSRAELRASEQRFRSVSESIGEFIWEVDTKGQFTFVSDRVETVLGYRPEELLGKRDCFIADSLDAERCRNFRRERMQAKQSFLEFEHRGRTKGGSLVWLSSSGSPIIDGEDRMLGFRGATLDISARKRSEDALHESEFRLRTILQTANEGFSLIDNQTAIIDINAKMCAMLGRDREEVLGKKILDFVDDENRAILEEQVALRSQGQEGFYEVALSRPDGFHVFCHSNATPLFDESGNVIGSFAMMTDISERKQSERSLAESEERYRVLFEGSPHGILAVDMETRRFVFANPAICRMFGYTQVEFSGLGIEDLHPEAGLKIVVPEFSSMASGEKRLASDIPCLRKDGTVFYAEISRASTTIRGRIEHVGFFTDVTERKLAEDALHNSKAMLERTERIANVGSWEWDVANDTVIWSKELYRIFGFDPGQRAPTWAEYPALYYREDMARLRSAVDKALVTGAPYELELRALRKNGQLAHCLARGFAEMAPDGRALRLFGSLQDITERKLGEEALKESQQQLADIIEFLPDATFVIDCKGRVVAWNRAMEEMTGVKASYMLGKGNYEYALPFYGARRPMIIDLATERRPEVEKNYVSLERKAQSITGEAYMPALGGGETFLFATASALFDSRGNATGAIESIRDITDRRRTEEALRASERRLRTILNTANEGFWLIDSDAVTMDVNPKMCALLGREQEQVLGRSIFDFVDNENRAIFDEQMRLRAKGEKGSYEMALSRPDGSLVFCEFRATPLFDGLENKAGAFAMVTDITERKRAEKAMEQTFSLLRNSFLAIQDLVSVHDRDLRVVLSNWYGRDHISEEERRSFPHCYACYMRRDEPCEPCPTMEVFRTRRAVRMEKENPYTQRITEVSAYPVLDASGDFELVAEHVRDITDLKKAEQEQEKLQAQLNQAQKMESVGRLAGGVAHDYNNMLAVIIGRAEMALRQRAPDKVRLDLEEILKAGRRSADLTRQLLAFARRQTATPEVLDLNDAVSGMLKMLRRLIGEDIDLSWMPGLDLWKVKIDPSQMDQILANLAVNARDAIPGAGAITIRTENVVIDDSKRAESPEFISGDYVLLTVSDTGMGMSDEVSSKIFEPFFTTKEVGQGTGLGLSTVYGIVKQNEGFIYVSSRLGEGTTFRIYLPRFVAGNGQVLPEEVSRKSPRGTETILLVEDEEAVLNLSRMMLEGLGYTVIVAHTPISSIQLAEAHQGDINLLITDVVMPEMNGRELAEQLRSANPGIKCLFMSGYTADVIARQGILDAGVNFIQKPFGINELAEKVRQVLEHSDVET